ncbi:MAG: glycosyltransferase family 4 protein [Luteolibacter sp.]
MNKERVLKVAALTVGDSIHIASTQYRLGQFVDGLKEDGVLLDLYPAHAWRKWPDLSAYDLVIVQKRLLKIRLVKRIRKAAKRLIFDTDDAIWEPHGRSHSWWTRMRTRARVKAIAVAADICTVPNRYLADALSRHARQVEIIPMALDGSAWFPAVEKKQDTFRVGWSGAPPNLIYLTELSGVLQEIQKERPEVEVVIYCGEKPKWPVHTEYHPFVPGTEADVVRTFDIGLLPLPDDAFAAGKSPIKALQYAACGVPCIASPVGATREIVQDQTTGMNAGTMRDWKAAILRLIGNADERKRYGQAARRMFLENHTHEQVQARLVKCWRTLADR